jgi:3-isopropylmalate/(R)-2-methylmalate dehydratase large subunit
MTPMIPKTISEKILSAASGRDARAGDVVVCTADLVIGTDASAPMAIDYFTKMGGERLHDPGRVMFALDHYAPPSSAATARFHDQVRGFARAHGATLHEIGEGISHQIAVERGRVRPGALVVGADSHTVTCGALNAFATGIGSSDLSAAMITGQVWLRVPETIQIVLTGARPAWLSAKDVALAVLAELGAEGANYHAVEYAGPSLGECSLEDRLVLANLTVESGAKTGLFPADDVTHAYLRNHGVPSSEPSTAVNSDVGARYARTISIDLQTVGQRVSLPHAPEHVATLDAAAGTPVQMVFIGTCTGGRVSDVRAAMAVLDQAGGRIAAGVQVIFTPASRDVYLELLDDGTVRKLAAMGVVITTPGCGACCGTSGAIPGDGMTVISTANRNFKARMGNATASIYLASPAVCAAAAVTGRITDPRDVERAL